MVQNEQIKNSCNNSSTELSVYLKKKTETHTSEILIFDYCGGIGMLHVKWQLIYIVLILFK